MKTPGVWKSSCLRKKRSVSLYQRVHWKSVRLEAVGGEGEEEARTGYEGLDTSKVLPDPLFKEVA